MLGPAQARQGSRAAISIARSLGGAWRANAAFRHFFLLLTAGSLCATVVR